MNVEEAWRLYKKGTKWAKYDSVLCRDELTDTHHRHMVFKNGWYALNSLLEHKIDKINRDNEQELPISIQAVKLSARNSEWDEGYHDGIQDALRIIERVLNE